MKSPGRHNPLIHLQSERDSPQNWVKWEKWLMTKLDIFTFNFIRNCNWKAYERDHVLCYMND